MAERKLVELSAEECLALLGSVPVGRVVFTQRALPAIRPVNHLLDQGAIVIRTHLGGGLSSAVGATRGLVVAYEADEIDPRRRCGWSVVVTGTARMVTDSRQLARYEELLLPWARMAMDCVIRIEPQLVSGYRLAPVGQDVPGLRPG